MQGWVSFHRKIEEWEWYDDANTFRLFFHLVLKANHKDNKWRGIDIKRGELVTSNEQLAKQLKLTVSKIRTSLNKLKSTREITIKTTNKNTVVTVVNYGLYQSTDAEIATKTTNKSQSNDNQIATNNNDNNENNDKKKVIKRFTPPTLEEIISYCKERKNKVDPEKFLNFYESKGWMVGKNKMKSWKASVRTWESKDKPEVKQSNNAFNNFGDGKKKKYTNEELKAKLARKNGG